MKTPPPTPNPSPQDDFESRLTALLLGEVQPGEEAVLRAAMAADPQLARQFDHLRQTLAVVREAFAPASGEESEPGAASPGPLPQSAAAAAVPAFASSSLQLSSDRREALLQVLQAAPTPAAISPRSDGEQPATKSRKTARGGNSSGRRVRLPWFSTRDWVGAGLLVAALVLLAGVVVVLYLPGTPAASTATLSFSTLGRRESFGLDLDGDLKERNKPASFDDKSSRNADGPSDGRLNGRAALLATDDPSAQAPPSERSSRKGFFALGMASPAAPQNAPATPTTPAGPAVPAVPAEPAGSLFFGTAALGDRELAAALPTELGSVELLNRQSALTVTPTVNGGQGGGGGRGSGDGGAAPGTPAQAVSQSAARPAKVPPQALLPAAVAEHADNFAAVRNESSRVDFATPSPQPQLESQSQSQRLRVEPSRGGQTNRSGNRPLGGEYVGVAAARFAGQALAEVAEVAGGAGLFGDGLAAAVVPRDAQAAFRFSQPPAAGAAQPGLGAASQRGNLSDEETKRAVTLLPTLRADAPQPVAAPVPPPEVLDPATGLLVGGRLPVLSGLPPLAEQRVTDSLAELAPGVPPMASALETKAKVALLAKDRAVEGDEKELARRWAEQKSDRQPELPQPRPGIESSVEQKLALFKKLPELKQEVERLGGQAGVSRLQGEEAEKLEGLKAGQASSQAAPIPQPEVQTAENPFSTFSLNVSDVSFKLAAAALEQGKKPAPAGVRSEEFVNGLDYRDPEPRAGAPLAFAQERARYPFAHNRDVLRLAVKTAATGRQPGRPLNLVLLLDNSGSMERADRVSIIQECLKVLAAQLRPEDRISVVTFARTARLWVDAMPGSQAGELGQRVGGLTPEGGTNLEEALRLGYQTALRHYQASGINRVVMLTDGAANLGQVTPAALEQQVEAHRRQGVAFDCFGIGWEGYNDDLLEKLSRHGDGRYGFVNSPEAAASGFAGQLAGALQVAASDVKVQVEFNPRRVTAHRQIGYAQHQLQKEQFRDNTVDAAEIGAAESGNALYIVQIDPQGEGPVGIARIRYKDPGTTTYHEESHEIPFTGVAAPLEQSAHSLRLAATSAAFAEWLASSPFAGEVTTSRLLSLIQGIPETFGADARPRQLETMIRQAGK